MEEQGKDEGFMEMTDEGADIERVEKESHEKEVQEVTSADNVNEDKDETDE